MAVVGYHRYRATRLLSKSAVEPSARRLNVRPSGGRDALGVLCEVSDQICSKRLKAMIAASLPALLRHGIIADDTALLTHLAVASPATIDRLPARFD